MLRRFASNRRGNMTVFMLGLLLIASLIVGGVIDFISLVQQKHAIQDLADRASVAAAREMVVSKAEDERVQAAADAFVAANYKGKKIEAIAKVADKGRAVDIEVRAAPRVFFPGPVGRSAKTVVAYATAEIAGGGNVCMIGLEKNLPSLDMKNKARVTAEDCAIYSNSTSKKSIKVAGTAKVKANLVCAAGGVSGPKTAIQPEAVTDCPTIDDPLRDRPMPDIGLLKCDYLATVVPLLTKVKLKPGIYCGGILVAGGTAELEPGMYVINNGALAVTLNGTLKGENVGFFLKGATSTLLFTPDTHISLTAPKTGPMAGILFFEDRNTILATYHQISSNDARRLVGTMYIPKSKLMIDATSPVFDKSEYTIIIAREFELKDGPELVLKTDYKSSPIPVPDGVGNKADPAIRLAK